MKFNVGFATDIGLKRSQNQDSGITCPDLGLFLVADGMGGHRGGEIASSMAVQIVPEQVRNAQLSSADWNPRHVINEAIQRANYAIYDRSLKDHRLQGMGTTTTAMLFKDNRLTIGHVGDSRAYLSRKGGTWQLTRDHSLVQEKLRAGLITREQAKTDQMRNVITRSVGFGNETAVELYEVDSRPGDVFLLCSDGLCGQVEDEEFIPILDRVMNHDVDLKSAVKELIDLANVRGGHDNTTVILVAHE